MNSNLQKVLRVVLSILLLVFGSNKFLGFIPMQTPPEHSFMHAIIETGYIIPILAVSEIVIGILFFINKWTGLALVWLLPISINIVLFHLKYDISTIWLGAVVAVLNILLIYANWKKFRTLF